MSEADEIAVVTAEPRFTLGFATTAEAIAETQALRYRIFAGEMGADIDGGEAGLDVDHYDGYCQHLTVRETATGRLVACTRILTDDKAHKAGGFYSAGEFDLKMIDSLPGRVMEVGRTCVDSEFRSGAVIAVLWQGLAEFIVKNGFDYLFGCASIGLEDGGANAHALLNQIQKKYMAEPWQQVRPLIPLPIADARPADRAPRLPPLLKAYFSLGAKACGEPYWDREFNCADVFVLLNVTDLHPRYARHFLDRSKIEETTLVAGHA
ncbi:GNAT family N-acyltransferase [Nevskia sp.]|uniref:GNAT family N-acetyltransferase n=1 Tax=Nevskia sp. TaxID=1929292 RepID=UPI0025F78115|nr:GNAT family N-acyltransferase [Nevskia sp.]